jgi:hypothetical protein
MPELGVEAFGQWNCESCHSTVTDASIAEANAE